MKIKNLLAVFVIGLVLFSANAFAALIAYYPFDDGSANDNSGNGNNGVKYGPTPVAGKVGNALNFDGVNDYISIPNSASMRSIDGSSAEYTIEFWIKTTQHGTALWSEKGIFDRRAVSSVSGKNHWVQHIYLDQNDAIGSYIYDNSVAKTLADNSAISDGNWHYIVVTRKGTQFLKIYVDGVLHKTDSTTSNPTTTEMTTIGVRRKNTGSFDGWFMGAIDEFKIYNNAQTDQQICESAGKNWDGTSCILGCNPGDERQCGTTGVGVCEYGTETCQGDRTWGTCTGAVEPVTEICGNGLDDDCDTETDEGCPTCNGCFLDGKCLPVGIRVDNGGTDSYCDIDYDFKAIKAVAEACYNDFECTSNNCADNVCEDVKGLLDIILNKVQQILDALVP